MRDTIFDPLRKRHVALTPEEKVRQYFIGWLNKERGYPLSLMASEYSIIYNKLSYRCDIVVFNKLLEPQIVVECKAPSVKLTNSVLEQVLRYNLVLRVNTLIITNGLTTFAFELDKNLGKYSAVSEIGFYNSK